MSIWRKLQMLDKRIIYAVFMLAVAFPLVRPIGIPLSVSNHTKQFYALAENLQKDDMVVIDIGYDAVQYPDVHPQVEAVCEHLARRGVCIYFLNCDAAAIGYAKALCAKLTEKHGYVYGTDMVMSPLLLGFEQGTKAFAENPSGLFAVDPLGNRMADMPMVKRLTSIQAFKYAMPSSSSVGFEYWLKQVPGMPLMCPMGTLYVPNIQPYLQSGQVSAILPGVRSAAEYERLLNTPGTALAKMDSASMGAAATIAFILLGNVAFFAEKASRKDD